MNEIKVVQIGMGPLGVKIANFIRERRGIATVAAVDKDSGLIGKDLGELCKTGACGVIVKGSLSEALESVKADVAILTTVSDMPRIAAQIEEVAGFGIPVVSTCEELSYPWLNSPELSAGIDSVAKANNVAVLGTGVNPGFLMDFLPLSLTAICQDVKKIKVSRMQNAAFRRIPFQKKIGAGLSLDEFDEKKMDGSLRHVGLAESMQMIASRMGWKLERTEDIIEPVVAEADIVSDSMTVKAGNAAGVFQTGRGFMNGEEVITLLFKAWIGEPDPHDCVEITGTPNLKSRIDGGVNGDIATCAIAVNAAKQVLKALPGLRTMADIPPVSFFS